MGMSQQQINEVKERVKKEMAERMEKAKEGDSIVEGLLRTGAMSEKRVNALLYVVGMILNKESEKYRKMEVSLSYNYLPIDKKFTNVIFYNYKQDGKEVKGGQICFEKTADFLDIMADLLTILKEAGKEIEP